MQSVPWVTKKLDKVTQKPIIHPNGSYEYEGYCIEFIKKLSAEMDFDYDLVIPSEGTFGQKVNGVWNGLVGDLAKGVNIKQ